MKCVYCSSNITNQNENCPKCGAPASAEDGFERCSCGMVLADKPVRFEINNIVCHKCYAVFKGKFNGMYHKDMAYPNGQITHLYATVGLICPECGNVFKGHEFYHGVVVATANEIREIAKETKESAQP